MRTLNSHFAQWQQFGLIEDDTYVSFANDSVLMTAFDICDRGKSTVTCSLRIDFTGTSILVCDLGGGSNFFDTKLNATDADVIEFRAVDNSPKVLADLAAKWLSQEFSKK